MARVTDPRPRTVEEMRAFRAASAQRARDAIAAKAVALALAPTRGFWDSIDTSAGPDACHSWRGRTMPSKRVDDPGVYTVGRYDHPNCKTYKAHRVLVFLTYGQELPPDMDVFPICDDHLCMNIRHLAVVPHGGADYARYRDAIPVEEFFCS